MKLMSSACLLATLPLFIASSSFAASYAEDFSISNGNPNGAWTYGYTSALTPGYALTKYTATATNSGYFSWLGNIGGDGTPVASFNSNNSVFTSTTVTVPAHSGVLHPGPGGQLSIARYTVPATGTYTLAATFTGDDTHGTTTDVHILLDGASLFSANVIGFNDAHSYPATVIALTAGDTIDFAVGRGSNDYTFDSTGLSATITPEPASLSLLGLSSLLLFRRKSR